MKSINRHILKFVLLILIFGIMSCQSDEPNEYIVTAEIDYGVFKIDIPEGPLSVNTEILCDIISPSLDDGQKILVVLRNNLRVFQRELKVRNGRSTFVISEDQSSQSGLYAISVFYNQELMKESNFNILANKAHGKIETYFGPKSLFVNDEDQSMIVTIPRDEFGNPSSNEVAYKSFVDQKLIELGAKSIDNLVSYNTIASLEKKGRKTLIASSDEAAIREQELIVKAGTPKSIQLNLLDYVPYADNRQYIHLVTDPIRDEVGNIVDDGTVVFYSVRDAQTGFINSNYSSMTINGVSTIYIKNPKVASEIIITAHHYSSAVSNDIKMVFDSYILDFSLSISDNNILTGPILAKTGQLITDGTIGLAEISSSGEQFETESINGQIKFNIDPAHFRPNKDSVLITIGGVSKSIAINYGEGI